MFESVLAEQNPHWAGTLFLEGVCRQYFSDVLAYLDLPQVISITGVRRSGKSTLLKQTINFLIKEKKVPAKNILFANLEHPYFSQYSDQVKYLEVLFEDYLKLADPKGKIYCFLDKVQFFNKWPVFIKSHYEQKGIKFLITGSNSFLMSHDLITLLSGRTLPIEVFPLSFSEVFKSKAMIETLDPLVVEQQKHSIRRLLDSFLRYGGFPEIVLLDDPKLSDDILNAYAKTILYQDVATRLNLKKPFDLEKLFYYLSSHIGSQFSYSGLSEIFDLSDKTIKEYVSALVDANLLFEVNRFYYSLKKQIRAEKKFYAIDTGMINAIAFKFSENLGKLFENVVYLELRRQKKEVYYYRTTADYEVDFIAKYKEQIELIQVCMDLHEKAEVREVRSLVQAAKELRLTEGILITPDISKQWVIDGITINAIPLYKFVTFFKA
jgi:predicted AAA+ superfamily ATPase